MGSNKLLLIGEKMRATIWKRLFEEKGWLVNGKLVVPNIKVRPLIQPRYKDFITSNNYFSLDDIIQLEDNSFIILGMSMSNDGEIGHNYGQKDLIIAKLSETGGLLAIKNIGGSENEYSYSIIKINQGEFLINAVTASNDHDVIEHNGILDNWLIIVKEIIE